ncbi:MAG: NosD domain-containing protein [Candidatus Bathyarchaeia archaeon]
MSEEERKMKKIISSVMLGLLLIGTLMFAFNIQSAKTGSTIYIKGDGSIYPPLAPISTIDNITYTLTNNVYEGIVIERDNIVFDGGGYMVQGGAIRLSNRANITIKNTYIRDSDYGIYLEYSSNCKIFENSLANNWWGIYLISHCSNNTIFQNSIMATGYNRAAIYLLGNCYDNLIFQNIVSVDVGDGIVVGGGTYWSCLDNKIYENNITAKSGTGINVGSQRITISGNIIANSKSGIDLDFSDIIFGNNITRNTYGIRMEGYSSSPLQNNIISGNNITKNTYGIYIEFATYNKFYHNNFVNNTQQVYSDSSPNVWDDGYPSGGNYWSDYTGVDANGDGIGDTAYVIDENNKDRYPLMKVVPEFPSIIILPLFVLATLIVTVPLKKKEETKPQIP